MSEVLERPAVHPAIAWGLTPRERQAVELYMVYGVAKLVAIDMGVVLKTAEIHLGSAKNKSGFRRMVPMVIAYDRAARCIGQERGF